MQGCNLYSNRFFTVLTKVRGVWRTYCLQILEQTKTFLRYFLHREWIYTKHNINVNVIVYLKWYIDFIMVAVYYKFFFFLFVYDNFVNAILWSMPLESYPPIPGAHFFRSLFSHFEIIIQKYDWWLQAIFFVVHSRSALWVVELIRCGILMVVFHTGYCVFDVSIALSWLRYSYYESIAIRNQIEVTVLYGARLNFIPPRQNFQFVDYSYG